MTMTFNRARRLGAERRFRQRQQISQDHLGGVWTVDDMMWHRTVTIRVIDDALASNEGFMTRLELATEELMHPVVGEGGIHPRISHPNAARPLGLDPGGADSPPLLVMELVEGLPLEAFLRQAGRRSPDLVVGAILAVAGALHAAHGVGVVHGGVNLSNVLLDSQGTVKVIDFGVAAAWVSTPGLVDAESWLAAYMAPELLAGAPPTPLSDAFSVGAILEHMLLGRLDAAERKEEASPIPPLPSPVEDRISHVCRSLLAEDPQARHQSLVHLMTELSALPPLSLSIPKGRRPQEGGEALPPHPGSALAETRQPAIPSHQVDRLTAPPLKELSVEVALRDLVVARASHQKDKRSGTKDVVSRTSERSTEQANPPRRRRWTRRSIVGLGCAIGIVIAAVLSLSWLGWGGAWTAHTGQSPRAGASSPTGSEGGAGSRVIVPPLRGLTASQAHERLMAVGLKVTSLKPVIGTPGIVQKSKPAPGKSVRRGTRVILFVGVSKVRLQDSG